MGALAVLPLNAGGRRIGLFGAYRRSPRRFTAPDLAALEVFAQAVAIFAFDRYSDAAALPDSPISIAVGMLMERHQLDAGATLALLRARAYATDTPCPLSPSPSSSAAPPSTTESGRQRTTSTVPRPRPWPAAWCGTEPFSRRVGSRAPYEGRLASPRRHGLKGWWCATAGRRAPPGAAPARVTDRWVNRLPAGPGREAPRPARAPGRRSREASRRTRRNADVQELAPNARRRFG